MSKPGVIDLEPPPDDSDYDEQSLIRALLSQAPKPSNDTRLGPGDDAAIRNDGSVITVDTMVEGVHFDDKLSPGDVGWKLVAVSVSDLAAMGARPQWMVLSISLPQTVKPQWIDDFSRGLAAALREYDVSLIGGDTTRSPGPIVVSGTLGGQLLAGPLLRSNGAVEDLVCVTGHLGLAGAGYLLEEPSEASLHALRHPTPPVPFALAIAQTLPRCAAMDISDGLATDLPRLCAASQVGAVIDTDAIPCHPDLRLFPRVHELLLAAGDDYQLLLTFPPESLETAQDLARQHQTRLAVIGKLTQDQRVRLLQGSWPTPKFAHFVSDRNHV